MNDTPPKFLKIGKSSVGLIGLEPAMARALAQDLNEDAAAEMLLVAIEKNNYVPAGARENYRAALGAEYERRRHGETSGGDELLVQVFGSGCVTCDKLESQIFDILARLGLAADIDKVFDLDDIWRHGIISPPALKINGAIKCQGKMPTPSEIEQWLKEAAAS
ncbi:MAG: thioredoxin family protein [Thermodesulfobacteriota bacterium]